MEEEKKEEVIENTKKKKGILSRIFDIILWVVLVGWIGICIMDYINVSKESDPQFCIKRETINYNDGTVDVCNASL